MVGNPIHRGKRPVSKAPGKKRPEQNPAKPFANRKHDARKSKIPFGERKFGEATTKPAADKSYFKKDARKSARPARGFGDETRFGDQKPFGDKKPYGAKPSFRDNPYFQKPQKESDRPAYGHPAKGDKKNKPATPARPFADKKPFGDRPAKTYGEKKPFGDRSARPAKSYGAKPEGQRYGNRNSSARPGARPQRSSRTSSRG